MVCAPIIIISWHHQDTRTQRAKCLHLPQRLQLCGRAAAGASVAISASATIQLALASRYHLVGCPNEWVQSIKRRLVSSGRLMVVFSPKLGAASAHERAELSRRRLRADRASGDREPFLAELLSDSRNRCRPTSQPGRQTDRETDRQIDGQANRGTAESAK